MLWTGSEPEPNPTELVRMVRFSVLSTTRTRTLVQFSVLNNWPWTGLNRTSATLRLLNVPHAPSPSFCMTWGILSRPWAKGTLFGRFGDRNAMSLMRAWNCSALCALDVDITDRIKRRKISIWFVLGFPLITNYISRQFLVQSERWLSNLTVIIVQIMMSVSLAVRLLWVLKI